MCGINGLIYFKQKKSIEENKKLINAMNDAIIHRGPDEEGVYVSKHVMLGMRRLSIIDLSDGHQPIYNEDRSLVTVFNGEIYNYKKLRDQLIGKGHVFKTNSDTETIIHCYEEYGLKCFEKLNGMFAIAIYDIKQKKLILARDRAGEKPLYYSKDNNKFCFASELKSMLGTNLIKKEINKKALNQYLQLTYVPAPLTMFQNVYKLQAGHYLVLENQELIDKQYWDVKYNDVRLIESYDECKKQLRKTLFNAVEECLVSDVPVGTFLSGGIDSTIITGIASKISGKSLDSFTIGYHDKQYDESDRVKLASELHHTKSHIFFLDYEDALPELDKLIGNLDEPFADSSYIPTYMVSKYSKQYVKTVLTGDAGDELFGGYSKYLIGYYADLYKKVPSWMRKHIIEKIIAHSPDTSTLSRKVRKVIRNSERDIFDQRIDLMCLGMNQINLKKLLKPEYSIDDSLANIDEYYHSQSKTKSELSKTLYTDLKIILEGDMLTKVDRASMFASLETRVPMLHKDVIELAARIPDKYKINRKNTKIILKDTFSDLIPDKLLNASKRGFGVPVGEWFRKELKNELASTFEKNRVNDMGIFQFDEIEKLINDHQSGKKNNSSILWALYVLHKWYENIYS